MKNTVCTVIGAAGGTVAAALGGWNAAIAALVSCMAVDYATGLIVAGVFHCSPKSEGGGLESNAGWKGLARKIATLLIVGIGYQMDLLLGVAYIRDAVIIGFCANEVISIIENAGLIGLPIPAVLTEAIDLLKREEDNRDGQ